MSRFFVGGDSSDEEDERSKSESEDEEVDNKSEDEKSGSEEGPEEGEGEEKPKSGVSRFMKGAASDEESEGEEEGKRVIKSAKDKRLEELQHSVNALKNHMSINDWNAIVTEFDKLNKALAKLQSNEKIVAAAKGTPRLYIAALTQLEDFVKSTQENKANIKMSPTNQKSFNAMKQRLKKHNKQYEKQIEEYRQNPTVEEEASEDEVEFESDEETTPAKGTKYAKKDVDQSDEEGSEEEEVEGEKKPKTEEKKELKPEEVKAKLKEILNERGRRGTDPQKQVEKLTALLVHAKEAELQVEIYVSVVSAQFDITKGMASYMGVSLWKSAFQNLMKVLDLLDANKTLILHESDEPEQVTDAEADEAQPKLVSGNLMAFVERFDDEFMKSLQAIDPHTQEYVQRLADENSFLDLAERAQVYYERVNKLKRAARVSGRRIEHIYYKIEKDDPKKSSVDTKALLEKLTTSVYAHGDERLKTRTILCHIYWHALHDRFYEARDMMLMSHLQENIGFMDISTQILFNRTMVQLGLCAFRANLIKQAHSCLSEMYGTMRIKELLAQGITQSRFGDKNVEQEKQERKRQLPFHMHINLELLEAVHLICAMLLEIPNMAQNAYDVKKKIISRNFHKYYDNAKLFSGPPESTRDIIIVASKSLAKGDWKRCEQLLLGLPVWNLLPKTDQVKAMLRGRIQEEGLRTFFFTYGTHYDSLSLEHLSQMFELSQTSVHQIVSKMILNEELHASWDQPSGSIIMHKVEPSRLQYLALQFADKAAQFVENNENLMNSRNVGYNVGGKDQQKGQQQGQRKYDQKGQQQQQNRSQGGQRRNYDQKGQHQQHYRTQGRQQRGGGGGQRRGNSNRQPRDHSNQSNE